MEYTTAGSAYAAYSCVNLAAPGSHGDRYRRDRDSGAGIDDMGMEVGWVRVPKFYILCSTFIYYFIYSANVIYIYIFACHSMGTHRPQNTVLYSDLAVSQLIGIVIWIYNIMYGRGRVECVV